GKLYGFYFRNVLPRIGTLISGVKGPYEYLPASVHKFPAPEQMLKKMEAAGFREVSWTPYTFGIAGLYRGKKHSAVSPKHSGIIMLKHRRACIVFILGAKTGTLEKCQTNHLQSQI